MPLKLVTGPANSAKAGEVLGGYRERLDEEPILVVPEFRDVEHAQREMAANGAVFGVRVLRFDRLWAEIARRVGYSARVATPFQREQLIAQAVPEASLTVLAASAQRPGFVRAAGRFISELGRAGITHDALGEALGKWAPAGPRRAYAAEVARVYGGYHAALERAGLVDRETFAWNTLAAFRAEPEGWGTRPVFVYGFDDFTEVQLAGLEALAERVDVVVSFPFERARHAFSALTDEFARLEAAADEHVELEGVADHYAPTSRDALHHLERGLFDPTGETVDARAAVRTHSAGGERAEVELAGASILDQLANGVPAGEIAVVFRRPREYASLVDQAFGAYGIPFSLERRVPFGNTPLGRGLLALLRCAVPELHGSADDLLTYMRTPGRLDVPGFADKLEALARQEGARTAGRAREIWEGEHPDLPLRELDALAGAADDPARLLEQLSKRLEWLFGRPYLRRAHVFAPEEAGAPRIFAAGRDAIAQLRELEQPPASVTELHDALRAHEVRLGEPPQPDRVQVAGPLEIRARRFQVVYLLGLQEGEFPLPGPADPFLADDDRREIERASGLAMPIREEQLDRERYLFYVCASRAERLLVLSWRTSDEEGVPQHPSFFLEDVRAVLDLPDRADAVRGLSDVVWSLEDAPTRHEWERAAAAAGPREDAPIPDGLASDELLRVLGEERMLSAAAIEAFADCPVKWLVDRLLRPEALEPDAEALVRGSFAHQVLDQVYTRLRDLPGAPRRVTRENLPDAERLLLEALRELQASFPISPDRTRVRTAVRRLEFDLLRYLRREAESASRFEPDQLEREFGEDGAPVSIGIEGLRLRGRIDRVDTHGGKALVRDYKSGKGAYPVDSWARDNRLQVAIYMLALRELEPELDLAGGVYDPLGGGKPKPRPRGLLLDESRDDLGHGWVKTDWRDRAGFEEALEEARDAVRDVVARLRHGDVKACPASCAWNGGCSYPSICRHEE